MTTGFDNTIGGEPERYEITTIEGLLDIPEGKLDDCLSALGEYCYIAGSLKRMGMPVPKFIWLDDGKDDIIVTVQDNDEETEVMRVEREAFDE